MDFGRFQGPIEKSKKRELEQAITNLGEKVQGLQVLVVPHLYDLPKGSESYKKLSELEGNLIVVSWIYSRAAHWVLDRNGIQGQVGEVLLTDDEDSESDDAAPNSEGAAEEVNRFSVSRICIQDPHVRFIALI